MLIAARPFGAGGTQDTSVNIQFKNYISDQYGIKVNNDGFVKKCYAKCDFYGFYNVGKDYNYAIRIEKTGDKIESSVDDMAMQLQKTIRLYCEH